MKRSYRFLLSILSILSFLSFAAVIAFIVLFAITDGYWYISLIIVGICYFLQIIIAFVVFFSQRIYEVKASWLLVLFIPIVSVVIFFIVGIIPFNIRKKEKLIKEKEALFAQEDFTFSKEYLKTHNNDITSIYNYQKSPIYKNNELRFLNQDEFLIETIKILDKAKKSINVEFYIMANSIFLRVFLNKLVEKAHQGIKVKLMYDFAGSHNRGISKKIKKLEKEGIEIAVFNPKGFNRFISMTNFRSHRKGVYVDNKYAITGGSNIADEYFNCRKNAYNWHDINFFIEGEIVHTQNLYFIYNWHHNSSKRKNCKVEYQNEIKSLKKHSAKADNIIQCVQTEPYSEYKLFKNVILSLISNAKKEVTIMTPYFTINHEIEEMLNYKAIQGVDVRIVIPGKPDNKNFIIDANNSCLNRFDSNVNFYFYDGFIHSKAILCDEELVLGTNNIDYRSMNINFESAFITNSKKIVKDFNKIKDEVLNESVLIDHINHYRALPLYKKFYMNLIKVIYPLI